MNTLYGIAQDAIALEQLLLEANPNADTADADATIVAKWLEELQGNLTQKLQRCIAYMREQELLAAAADDEIERLTVLKNVRMNRVKRVKEAIKYVFEVQDLRRVDTPLGAVTLAENGGQQGLELLRPVEELPGELISWKASADVDAIRKKLEAGETLTYARLKPRGHHIRVQGR